MLEQAEQDFLLNLAREQIYRASTGHAWVKPNLTGLPDPLIRKRACFVTLHKDTALRGCIGSMQARESLAIAVGKAARDAALHDPRFPAVKESEVVALEIEISVLSELTSMQWDNEADLVQQLKPMQDGLLLRDGSRSGTFLPSVWKTFEKPEIFWRQLKRKAGLQDTHWSTTLSLQRYTTYCFLQKGR
jgi:uncharacterized protein